jgi:hypothetical protein
MSTAVAQPVVVGGTVRVTITTEVDGVLTDPDEITATILDPNDGGGGGPYTLTGSAELAQLSTGVHRLTIPVTIAGRWFVKVETTGGAAGVDEADFYVEPSNVTA